MKIHYAAFVLLITIIAGCNSSLTLSDVQILEGVWEGRLNGHSSPSTVDSIDLFLTIKILNDGKVSGSIGDASLKNCRVERNRGSIARALNFETDYIIQGKLSGAVDESDTGAPAERDITLPFSVENGHFTGTLFVIESWAYPAPLLPRIRIARKSPKPE